MLTLASVRWWISSLTGESFILNLCCRDLKGNVVFARALQCKRNPDILLRISEAPKTL